MEAYKLFVRTNRDFVHSLESLANGITWLLPERFSNSEIVPEAIYAILGIISSVNQHIIDTIPTRGNLRASGESSLPWSLLVSMLKDAETVVEVAAQYYFGENGKWNFLTATEGMKALVRFAAFHDSGYRMLFQGGELVNERSLDISGGHHARSNGHRMNNSTQDYNVFVPASLEGRAMSALNRFGEKAKLVSDASLLNRIRRPSEASAVLVGKPTISRIWSQRGISGRLLLAGEALCILRPLIYVMFIRKYGISSWTPWLVSFAVDLTGMSIISYATSQHCGGGDKLCQLSTSEKDELKRRKLICALYIMRDPFFTKYTKRHLEKIDQRVSPVPIIGLLTAKLVELIVGAQTRYTYTSGS